MITERFLGEPKLVLLWHHNKKKTHLEKHLRVKLKRTAHKNNFTLLALIDPWRILNIHGTFTFHKGFITVGKCSLDFLNAPHTKKKIKNLRTDHWKVIWGTKNCYSVALLSVSSVFSYQVKKKKQLKTFILKSVQNTP